MTHCNYSRYKQHFIDSIFGIHKIANKLANFFKEGNQNSEFFPKNFCTWYKDKSLYIYICHRENLQTTKHQFYSIYQLNDTQSMHVHSYLHIYTYIYTTHQTIVMSTRNLHLSMFGVSPYDIYIFIIYIIYTV